MNGVNTLKNKKRNWKYFEEAYSHLCTIEIKNSPNLKNTYMEIKQVADWIYFKIFYLKLYDSNTINSIVSTFKRVSNGVIECVAEEYEDEIEFNKIVKQTLTDHKLEGEFFKDRVWETYGLDHDQRPLASSASSSGTTLKRSPTRP